MIDPSTATWRKSSYSNGSGGICVEVGFAAAAAGVRDSKLGAASPVLSFSDATFAAFLDGVKGGRFQR